MESPEHTGSTPAADGGISVGEQGLAPASGSENSTPKHPEGKPVRSRSKVALAERRARIAELLALGLSYRKAGEALVKFGIHPVSGKTAYADHQQFIAETKARFGGLERKADILSKLDSLYALTLQDRQNAVRADGSVDPYARATLTQRAMDIVERMAELEGFISRKGVNLQQVLNAQQNQMGDADILERIRGARARKDASMGELSDG